jgi:hypothetical protein
VLKHTLLVQTAGIKKEKKICQRPIIILSICFASIGAEKSKKKDCRLFAKTAAAAPPHD